MTSRKSSTSPHIALPLALAGVALVLVAAGGPSRAQILSTTPTLLECETAWDNSDASVPCNVDLSVSVSGTSCRVVVQCPYRIDDDDGSEPPINEGRPSLRQNDFTGTVTELESLKNCDGTLKAVTQCW